MSQRQRTSLPPLADLSKELQVVLACCVADLQTRSVRLDSLLAASLDWKTIVKLIERHRMEGLANRALSKREHVPEEIRSALRTRAQHVARAALQTVVRLTEVSQAFEANGVPFLVLKGLPLAWQAYGDLAIRQSKDLDILVPQEQVEVAAGLLSRLGYERMRPGIEMSPSQARKWLRARKHFEFRHKTSGTLLELHWRTSDNVTLDRSQVLFSTSRPLPLTGQLSVSTPQGRPLLDFLAAHGAIHRWFRLKWLADVAALLHADPRMADEPAGLPFDNETLSALELCHHLLGTPCVTRSTSTSKRLSVQSLEAIQSAKFTAEQPIPPGSLRARLRQKTNLRYLREEIRVGILSLEDWVEFPLPSRLEFFYPLLRFPLFLRRRLHFSRR